MSKLKLFFIKIGIIPAPPGFKYAPLDVDGDGVVQEGTKYERSISLDELKAKRPVKKAAPTKAVKKAPAKKKPAKKAPKKAK